MRCTISSSSSWFASVRRSSHLLTICTGSIGSEAKSRVKKDTLYNSRLALRVLNHGSLAGEQQEEANVHGNRKLFRGKG